MPFQLEVQITMRQVDERGGYMGGNELRVQEAATLGELDFGQVAAVLARFHELTESVKGES